MENAKKYTVLVLGSTTYFEFEKDKIDSLINRGAGFIREINAKDRLDAQRQYSNSSKNSSSVKEVEGTPINYLKTISTLFLILSIIGCCFFLFLGIQANSSYTTRDSAFLYFIGAGVNLIMTLLIHSICKVIVYIAEKK